MVYDFNLSNFQGIFYTLVGSGETGTHRLGFSVCHLPAICDVTLAEVEVE